MKYRNLGKNSLSMSELTLGGMSLPTSLKETIDMIDYASSQGITWIDTADLYEQGANEERIGHALATLSKDFSVATKVGNRFQPCVEGWSWDPDPKWINQAIENSLKRLQRDEIDLYQLHGGTNEDPWDDIIETFERLKEKGLIREYGISSIRPNVIYPYFQKSSAVSVMMQYSALDRRPESLFPFFNEHQIGLLVRGGQAKGLLTDQSKTKLEKVKSYGDYKEDELLPLVTSLQNNFPDLGAVSLHQILNEPTVTSVVIGSSKLDQLKDTMNNYHTKVNSEAIDRLRELSPQQTYKEHTE